MKHRPLLALCLLSACSGGADSRDAARESYPAGQPPAYDIRAASLPGDLTLSAVWVSPRSGIVYAAGYRPAGGVILRSLDRGETWLFSLEGEASRLRAITGEGDEIYAVGDGGVILRSRDEGGSWEPLRSGLEAARLPSGRGSDLRAVWAGGGEVCAAGSGGALLCSGDRGETWRGDPELQKRGDDLTGVFGLPEGDRFVSSRGGLVLHKTAAREWHVDERAEERVGCVEIETPHQTVTVRGGLTEEVVSRGVKRANPGIRFCFESTLQRNPSLWGGVTIRFRIGADGVVSSSESEAGGLGRDIDSCVAKKIAQLSFPAAEDGRATAVSYPFFFAPRGPVCEERALPLYGLTGSAAGEVYALGERSYFSSGSRGATDCRSGFGRLCREFPFSGWQIADEQLSLASALEVLGASPLTGVGALYGAVGVSSGGAPAPGVYAVGARGAIVYNSGASPLWRRIPSGTGAELYGVAASPWGELYIVGAKGTLLILGGGAPAGEWW
jgi:hypothetical protein